MSEEKKKRPVSRSREAFKARRKEQAGNEGRKKDSLKAVGTGMAAAAVICIGGYIYQAGAYTDTYFPNTKVNGMEVGGKTADEVKDMIASEADSYRLCLSMRQNETAQISGNEIRLLTEFDGSLEEILRQQDPYSWPLYLLRGPEYDIKALISYDETQLAGFISGLSQSDPETAEAPADAVISEYEEGKGYSILPESEGALLNQERTLKAAGEAICGLLPELDLDQAGCYEAPAVRLDDPALKKRLEQMNRFALMSVTYTFGSRRELLDGKTIGRWISYDENNQPVIDEEQLAAYVKALGSEYNTAYTKRKFKTSYGPEVEVAGVYGWRIDGAGEKARLKEEILAGEPVVREPVYLQTAASREGNDYGTTYAEVNLTAQHLFFYKDGKKILESDFVSGNPAKGHTTPPGLFSLTYKQRDAVLKGEGYASPVKFWMPFNGGIGFHDASWRNTFGGTIYKKSGSHGCINMPYEAAKTLYENVYKGMPVICYNLEGTESSRASSASGKAEVSAPASPPSVPETVPPTVPQTVPETEPSVPSQPEETVPEPPKETQPPKPSEEISGPGGTQSAQNPGPGTAGPGAAGSPSLVETNPGADTPETTPPNDVIIQPVGR